VRADLREEFDMADEAFALSPISARATLPSEEDYAAIAEAFMETSRGRWFLTEYAKRNRNADTHMVLDAVARIEQSLAAQREETLEREASLQRDEGLSAQQAAEAVAAAAAAQDRLTEALAAIRSSVEAAEESAVEALDSLALEQRLAPVRKGARVIREIAWRLREIGNDGRICDLIDSQVSVIEAGAAHISSDEAKAALSAAFATIAGQLAELSDEAKRVVESNDLLISPMVLLEFDYLFLRIERFQLTQSHGADRDIDEFFLGSALRPLLFAEKIFACIHQTFLRQHAHNF